MTNYTFLIILGVQVTANLGPNKWGIEFPEGTPHAKIAEIMQTPECQQLVNHVMAHFNSYNGVNNNK